MSSKNIKIAALIFVFLVACLFTVLYFSSPKTFEQVKVTDLLDEMEQESALDFQLKDINGKEFRLSDYKGKVIVVSFWASWCDPCVEEFPSMIKLVEKFKGEVVLIALSKDYEKKEITKFLNIFKIKTPHLIVAWDNQTDPEMSQLYQVSALPESFVIGKDFKLKRKVPGSEDWFTPEAIHFFEVLLSGQM